MSDRSKKVQRQRFRVIYRLFGVFLLFSLIGNSIAKKENLGFLGLKEVLETVNSIRGDPFMYAGKLRRVISSRDPHDLDFLRNSEIELKNGNFGVNRGQKASKSDEIRAKRDKKSISDIKEAIQFLESSFSVKPVKLSLGLTLLAYRLASKPHKKEDLSHKSLKVMIKPIGASKGRLAASEAVIMIQDNRRNYQIGPKVDRNWGLGGKREKLTYAEQLILYWIIDPSDPERNTRLHIMSPRTRLIGISSKITQKTTKILNLQAVAIFARSFHCSACKVITKDQRDQMGWLEYQNPTKISKKKKKPKKGNFGDNGGPEEDEPIDLPGEGEMDLKNSGWKLLGDPNGKGAEYFARIRLDQGVKSILLCLMFAGLMVYTFVYWELIWGPYD